MKNNNSPTKIAKKIIRNYRLQLDLAYNNICVICQSIVTHTQHNTQRTNRNKLTQYERAEEQEESLKKIDEGQTNST